MQICRQPLREVNGSIKKKGVKHCFHTDFQPKIMILLDSTHYIRRNAVNPFYRIRRCQVLRQKKNNEKSQTSKLNVKTRQRQGGSP